MTKAVTTIMPGNGSTDPFTIVIVANPAIETPWTSGVFSPDPILSAQSAFISTVDYICAVLFGKYPGQAEIALGDPAIGPRVRVISVFDSTLPATDDNALVGLDSSSFAVVARRDQIAAFVAGLDVGTIDVVYAVSANLTHTRASAWPANDDTTRGGIAYMLDGITFEHSFWTVVPGTVAIHTTGTSLTALHEFQHAIGSYENGQIADLYVDSSPAVNCKTGQPPVPPNFCDYNGAALLADPARDSLGYPPGWSSYHCALHNTTRPAIMDNYWLTTVPAACENDLITRSFVTDRLLAKLSR